MLMMRSPSMAPSMSGIWKSVMTISKAPCEVAAICSFSKAAAPLPTVVTA